MEEMEFESGMQRGTAGAQVQRAARPWDHLYSSIGVGGSFCNGMQVVGGTAGLVT